MILWRIYNPRTKEYFVEGSHWNSVGTFFDDYEYAKRRISYALHSAVPQDERHFDYASYSWITTKVVDKTLPPLMLVAYKVEEQSQTVFYDLVSATQRKKYIQKMDPRDIVKSKIEKVNDETVSN